MSNAIPSQSPIGDTAARVRQGAYPGTPPELLYFLARDPAVTVRAAVAMNSSTPASADAMLANDPDDRVRAVLGRKIALLSLGLCEQGQTRLERVIRSLLGSLVIDEAERVRAIVADVLKDMPNAPADVVRILAHDTAISVCEPIIRLSPLLSEEDLIQLLAAPPCPGTCGAVARRAGLSEAVSDAVVATANSAAIRDLLCNQSAAIREATLDSIVAKAKDHNAWHEPLVRRPALSPPSMRALCHIVADHLIDVLTQRADLDPDLSAYLRTRVRESRVPKYITDNTNNSPEALMAQVRTMERAGKLNENSLTQAIRSGDEQLVTAIMAVAANVPLVVVERAISLRTAKGLVSIIWRAGYSMRSAVAVQVLLARLSPRAVISANATGGFPLSGDEMRWQLEFLEHAAH